MEVAVRRGTAPESRAHGRLLTPDAWDYPAAVYLSFGLLAVPLFVLSIALFEWDSLPVIGAMIVPIVGLLAVVWPRQREHPKVLVAVGIGTPVFIALVAWLTTDLTAGQIVHLTVGLCVVSALISAGYRWLMRDVRWTPMEPVDLFGSSIVVLPLIFAGCLLGILPGTHPFTVDAFNLWWATRATTYTVIGCLTLPVLWWFPGGWPTWRRDLMFLVVLLPLGLISAAVVLRLEALPLAWLVIIPSFAAGWLLSPRGAALYGLGAPLATLAYTLDRTLHTGADGPIGQVTLTEVMSGAAMFVCMMIALFRNRTAVLEASLRKEQEESEWQARMLRGVFDSMTEGVLVLDGTGQVIIHNDPAQHLLGPIPHGDLDAWVERAQLFDENGQRLKIDQSAMREAWSGKPTTHQLQIERGGARRWLGVTLAPVAEADRAVAVLRDVTANKVHIEELQSFAGVVAHDLRSPLASLRGWLEILDDELNGESSPAVQHAVTSALSGSSRLGALVDDWLSFTVGRDADLSLAPAVLADLATAAVADLAVDALVTIEAPHQVYVDAALVRQVFANTCGNAVKFAREGQRPSIEVRSVIDADPQFVRVDVSDNGIGIPPGEERRIFDEFHRARAHLGHASGTGLGLALCRRLVERHGGTISARNNADGPGATVSFTLPREPVAP